MTLSLASRSREAEWYFSMHPVPAYMSEYLYMYMYEYLRCVALTVAEH